MVTSYETDRFAIRFRRCAEDLLQQGVAALGELHDLCAPRLVRYAMTLSRNQSDAEDALQAAFVQVARDPRKLARARQPWPYLLKIIRNEAIKIHRKCRTQPLDDAFDTVSQADSGQVVEVELGDAVRAAVGKLPPVQAEVVALKIWENMTFVEIGEILGVSQNTAASRYRYALEKLTQYLRELNPEAGHVI